MLACTLGKILRADFISLQADRKGGCTIGWCNHGGAAEASLASNLDGSPGVHALQFCGVESLDAKHFEVCESDEDCRMAVEPW